MATHPLTSRELDGMRCTTPGCTCGGDDVVLVPACHRQGADVCYRKGVLTLRCFVCKAPITAIAVASLSGHLAATRAPTNG
jgi:hypothetical protein